RRGPLGAAALSVRLFPHPGAGHAPQSRPGRPAHSPGGAALPAAPRRPEARSRTGGVGQPPRPAALTFVNSGARLEDGRAPALPHQSRPPFGKGTRCPTTSSSSLWTGSASTTTPPSAPSPTNWTPYCPAPTECTA